MCFFFFLQQREGLAPGGEAGLDGEGVVLPFSYFCSYTSISNDASAKIYFPDFVPSSKGASEPIDLSIW